MATKVDPNASANLSGLTVRAELSARFMAALLSSDQSVHFTALDHRLSECAHLATKAADALIAELNKEAGE